MNDERNREDKDQINRVNCKGVNRRDFLKATIAKIKDTKKLGLLV